MKKGLLSIAVASATLYSFADYKQLINLEHNDYKIIKSVSQSKELSDWINKNTPYNCSVWSPSIESVTDGVTFNQDRTCLQDQEKTETTYTHYSDGSKKVSQVIVTESQTVSVDESQSNTGTDTVVGGIIVLKAAHNSTTLNAYNVNETNNANWESLFGQSYDIVLNQVAYANSAIRKTGVINWFNPDKKASVYFSEGCSDGDTAHADVEYLDENNNILLWYKTRSYGSYGLYLTYGTTSDKSGGFNPGVVGPYPSFTGLISFNKNTDTVYFNNSKTENYVNSWSASVDVSEIKKIRLSYSNVLTNYTGGTCGAQVMMKIQ